MTLATQSARRNSSEPIVTGEFGFSAANFREIAALVKAESGIDLPEAKATLVYSRLTKRLRAIGLQSFSEYCDQVREDDEERASMITALTTNVTRFFREPHHFEHLRRSIIEPMAEKARRGGRIRLWSSACSSGQEPYSMALTVLSVLPNAADLDVRILATDLNANVVAHGRRGIYQPEELRDVPVALRSRWFETAPADAGGGLQIAAQARALVSFRELNLMGKWPMKGTFDAIFCRNVAIYFDRDTQSTIWLRLARLLRDDGALYIGHSERTSGPAAAALANDGITTYRLKGKL